VVAIGTFRVENGKILGAETFGGDQQKFIGNLAYQERLFYKKPCADMHS